MAILLFLLSVVFEITVFLIAMVDSAKFTVEKKQIWRFSMQTSGGFLPPAHQMCIKMEAHHYGLTLHDDDILSHTCTVT